MNIPPARVSSVGLHVGSVGICVGSERLFGYVRGPNQRNGPTRNGHVGGPNQLVQGPRGVLWSPAANTECYIFLKTTDSLPSDSGHKTCQTCAVFMIIRHQLSLIPYIFG